MLRSARQHDAAAQVGRHLGYEKKQNKTKSIYPYTMLSNITVCMLSRDFFL